MRKQIERLILSNRWVLVLFLFGLMIVEILYCIKFLQGVWDLCKNFRELTENNLIVEILSLIDMVMIGCLPILIIKSNYQSYINKLENDHFERVTGGMLKVKISSSLIIITGIHLLSIFLDSKDVSNRDLIIKGGIALTFVIFTLVLAYVENLHVTNSEKH